MVAGGSKASKLPLEQSKIHQCTAVAKSPVAFLKVDPNLLDIMLTWEQSGGYEVHELEGGNEEMEDDDWMSRILQAKVFHKIPPANIQSIFMKMEPVHCRAGEAVIKQGDEGDRFFIVREGQCKVVRKTRKNPEGVVLAKLGVGDNFGEEALISGGKRNASVVMLTKGVLMSLSKDDFLELMNEPLLHWVNFNDARGMVQDGAVWIDVRLPSEYQSRHIRGSINLPLPILRSKLDKLSADKKYIVCCDTGRRSSTATYLLTQNNIDAYVLESGLQMVPAEAIET
jgi:CRP-like cAMP-binding protein